LRKKKDVKKAFFCLVIRFEWGVGGNPTKRCEDAVAAAAFY